MHTRPATITSIPLSPEQERKSRMIRYSIAMGIRVVCIVLCLVVPGWWILIPAAGAIFLPYLAVVLANNVGSRTVEVTRPGSIVRLGEPDDSGTHDAS